MTVLDLLLDPGMRPFAIAIGIVTGLLVLELAMVMAGISLFGESGDAPDLDGPDLDAPDLDGPDIDAPDLDAPDLDAPAADLDGAGPQAPGGVLSWLGLGQVPFIIWLAGLLTAFGLAGYVLQLAATGLAGGPLPALWAALAAAPVALVVGARFARGFGRLIPKTQTSSISRRSYHSRIGVVSVGTARRGMPAQVRFTDGHGNFHYLMVEPLKDDEAIPEGTRVAILRLRGGRLRILRLDDPAATVT